MKAGTGSNFTFDVTSSNNRSIRAETILRELKKRSADPLVVSGAVIMGKLDASDLRSTRRIEFRNCAFSDDLLLKRSTFELPLSFESCQLKDVSFEQSTLLHGLVVNGEGSTCRDFSAELCSIDGRVTIDRLKANSLNFDNATIKGDVIIFNTTATDKLRAESVSIGGKLHLRQVVSKGELRLRYGKFGMVFLDAIDFDAVNAQSIVVERSFHVGKRDRTERPEPFDDRRSSKIANDLTLEDSRLGGRVTLTSPRIGGEVVISGLRAATFDLNRGRLKRIRCRGATLNAFLIKNLDLSDSPSPDEGAVTLQRSTVGEISILYSKLASLDLSDTTVNGSVYLRNPEPRTLRKRGTLWYEAPERPTTIDFITGLNVRVQGAVLLRDAVITQVAFYGLHCDTFSLMGATGLKSVSLRNLQVESVTSITKMQCDRLSIETSNLSGVLHGTDVTLGALDIASSKINAQTTLLESTISSVGIKDTKLESLIFEGGSLERLWLYDVKAANLRIGKIRKQLQNITVEASNIDRFDTSEAAQGIECLSIVSSTIDALDILAVPAFRKRRVFRKAGGRDLSKLPVIDLSGTTYKTIKCDVHALTKMWKARDRKRAPRVDMDSIDWPYVDRIDQIVDSRKKAIHDAHIRAQNRKERFSATLRPSLAVLETALRAGGYDDWADEVYVDFRQVGRHEVPLSMQLRNRFSYWCTGYGRGVVRPVLALALPVVIALIIASAYPGFIIRKDSVDETRASMLTHRANTLAMLGPNEGNISVPIYAVADSSSSNVSHQRQSAAPITLGERIDLIFRSYVPGAGEAQSVRFSNCSSASIVCGDMLGDLLRILGWLSLSIFLATLSGILRYSTR